MATPRLSVVVTAYNRPEGLDRTLASLAAQTRPPDELLVFDDCSPTDLTPVAERWRERFPGFRFVRHAANLGMPGNLNAACAAARGDVIANLHDADAYPPRLLERWEAALDEHRGAWFVFSPTDQLAPGPRRRLRRCAPCTPGRAFFRTHFLNAWRAHSPVWGTVMQRRAAFERLGPFDPAFGAFADVDYWMRCCLHGDVAYAGDVAIRTDPVSHFRTRLRWPVLVAQRDMFRLNLRRHASADTRESVRWGDVPLRWRAGHRWVFASLYLLWLQSALRHGPRGAFRAGWSLRGEFLGGWLP